MSICVDKESKEFKRLVDKLDIHPDNLELAIYELLNDESRTDNPTEEEILLKFTPKPFIDNMENIEWYYTKEHDKPKVFLDRHSAEKEQSLRDSFYGKGTNILYRNSKGEFVVKTGSPVNTEIISIREKAIADGTYMKAPNRKVTNLSVSQWLYVRTKAFKEWFGDWENDPDNASKVLDENGEPMVTWHSSLSEIKDNTFRNYEETTISKNTEWITNKTIEDYKKEGYVISTEDIDNYVKGKDITIKRPNGIYSSSSRNVSNSYTKKQLEAFEEFDLYTQDNAEHKSEAYSLEEEGIYETMLEKAKSLIEEKDKPYNIGYKEYEKKVKEIASNLTDEEMKKRHPEGRKEYIAPTNPYNTSDNILGSELALFSSSKNPLIVDAKFSNWNNISFQGKVYSTRTLESYARNNGFDGIIIKNVYDIGAYSRPGSFAPSTIVAVFNPNQIKSATKNEGPFKGDNIYKESIYGTSTSDTRDNRLLKLYNLKKTPTITSLLLLLKDSEYSNIITLLQSKFGDKKHGSLLAGVKVKLVDPMSEFNGYLSNTMKAFEGRRAYYDADTKTIYIDILGKFTNGNASSVILHEIMHAITVDKILSNPESKAKLKQILEDYQKEHFDPRYADFQKHSLEEFIANIWSDPKTIKNLKNTKSPRKEHSSLWNEIKLFFNEVLSNLFGNIDNDSLFAEASVEMIKLLDVPTTETAKGKFKDNLINDNTIENTNTQDENEDQELNISEENQAYMEKTQSINEQLDALNESTLLSATEINDVAEQIVFWISDYITRLQSEPGYAAQQFGEQFKDKDFSTMDRAEVVRTIGANNIVAICRENFNPKNAKYNSIKTIRKARQICNNFEAVLYKAQPLFLSMEKFSISISKDGSELDINENINGDNDNFNMSNSETDVKEIEGDLREHWSVETKTLDVLDHMTSPVRRELQQCYLTGANGEKVVSEFGVNRRIDVRKATNSIIKWTQGAVTYDEMVKKLSDKIESHPWVKQLVDKLNDKSGDYTDFQSLFFGDFCKHFQSYYVVIEDNGIFKSIPVNEEPALSNVYKQIEAQYKAGEHTLFNFSGINESEFKELESTLDDLTKFKEEGLSATNKQEVARLISYASTVLGYTITGELVSENLNEDTFKTIHEKLSYIVKSIKSNIDNPDYKPFKFKSGGDIVTNLKDFLRPITQSLEDVTTSSTFNNGKMYQSNIVPSYTTKLFQKFSSDSKTFEKFIMEEYGDFPWFKNDTGDIDTGWRNEWLKEMVLNPAARALFKHKVQLNFNKRNYMKNMTDMDYTVSALTEYFSGNSENGKSEVPAWFRVPMLSNKPSSEFIRFISYRGPGYKDTLTTKFYSIFRQELDRIQTVITRGLQKGDPDYIENFDINGKKFMFLDFLNDYLPGATKANTELGKLISDYIDGKDINEIALDEKAKEVIKKSMEAKAQAIVNNWEAQGIVKAANKIQNAGKDTNDIKANLINFVWNDTFAAMNIMQLTITDPAFYKHAEDLQKRLAQIHAPGVRGRDHAIDYKGNDVTDGKFRTIKLTDFDGVVSNVIDNLTEVFDRKIDNAAKHEKPALIALKESLVGEKGAFRYINVADAQGYSSPTSYRKKAFRFGKWSKKSEEIYKKLLKGEYNYSDLKVAFQPLKPFVYSQVIKETGVKGAVFNKIKVPIQFKNSEYLLIMADAILQGEETSKPNLLRAIYEVMEESHFDQQTGEYKTNGIDTVQFESTTKSGKSGTINLNDLVDDIAGEAIAKERIRSAIYKTEERKISEVNPETGAIEERIVNIKTDTYSNAVDVIPEEDYCLQQEVPEHFKNHYQVHGTQGRYIIPSELESVNAEGNQVTYTIIDPNTKDGYRIVTAQEFKQEYEKTIAENIQESIEELSKELYLDSSNIKDRNIALSRILQKEILSSPRYGIDLLVACSVDENGKFRIPLGDPIQSKRVEQLITSIVKNRINKQEIAGGPVVQVSNFGTSKQLSIRFKDKVNGGILMSKEEWEQNKTEHNSYKDYIKENQGGIAYFECFAPIYTNELFTKFADSKGNIDIKAIEKVEPELLKMVGYRI